MSLLHLKKSYRFPTGNCEFITFKKLYKNVDFLQGTVSLLHLKGFYETVLHLEFLDVL